ncbi:MAG TPA: glycosyltransferase family 1 protein [Actinomycetota bacterium]|nr:glycosyltransferase family 1 protein [Actinomycetota bacterium]
MTGQSSKSRFLRIGYDAAPLLDAPTGVGRYAGELARALTERGVEIVRFAVSWGAPRAEGVRRWRIPARLARAAWRRWDRPPIERLTGRVDLVHATNFVLPALKDTPGVVTVHDLSFLRDDTWPGGHRLRDLVPWSVERAAAVIVPTHAIAAEVCVRLRVPEPKVHVTPEGVAPVFFGAGALGEAALAHLGIGGPFVVAAGTIEPRKNLPVLLEAWRRVQGELDGWTLVLAGPKGWGPDLPPTPGVLPVGWIGDETLPGLLAAAEIFCYPSLYEGFGLPPLEAMAAGTPAVVGRYSAAEEVLGDAAVLVDPHDPGGFAEALRTLGTDAALRRSYVVAGKAHAAGYTWSRTAATTIDAYRSIS